MKVHNPDNLPTAPIAEFLPSQGKLKDLDDKNYKKLKKVIKSRGFRVPVFIWVDKDGNKHKRMHHIINWRSTVPKIVQEKHKKSYNNVGMA